MDTQTSLRFDGPDVTEKDTERLTGQLYRVFRLMADAKWRTLAEIAREVEGSEAGVSARLRDIRKARFQEVFGRCTVERERVSGGLFQYRLLRHM
jgi:hypothetical protein